MLSSSRTAMLLAVLALALPTTTFAHSFGQMYTLPVPVWLYLWSSAAALLLSFLVVGWFVNARSVELNLKTRDISQLWLMRILSKPWLLAIARLLSVAGLLLSIATGLFGTDNAYLNFNMTFFWVIFLLGYCYLSAVLGNSYSVLNPWRIMFDWGELLHPGLFKGRLNYPEKLGYWPALLLYMAFISFELFGDAKPFSTAIALSGYTVLNIIAAWLIGRKAWFQYGELFAVFLRVISLMAPLHAIKKPDGQYQVLLRQPMIGLSTQQVTRFSLLLFVLFMLSSTGFDGIKSTEPYVRIYWVHVAEFLKPWVGDDIVQSFPRLKEIYFWWQLCVLALSPFFYLGIYWLFIWLTRLVSGCQLSTRELACRFGYSLVPIAFVYHVTHYYGLLLSQGTQITRLISDPFGFGWNLFGTAGMNWKITLEAGTIWHTQVFLILFGHIISVYLAHLEALKIFGDNRRAALSQLPMLLLMMVLTCLGLWILSLPISRG